MLCDVVVPKTLDPVLAMIAEINKNSVFVQRLATGIYEDGSFNFDKRVQGQVKSFMEFTDEEYFQEYGVCDNYQQILEKWPQLETSAQKFVISVTPIVKEHQSEKGGWRWHKWGVYIGTSTPTTEYLYDEPLFEKVYSFHIYELV